MNKIVLVGQMDGAYYSFEVIMRIKWMIRNLWEHGIVHIRVHIVKQRDFFGKCRVFIRLRDWRRFFALDVNNIDRIKKR